MHSAVKLLADVENAKIQIGENGRICGRCVHAFKSIEIGRNCLIAANVQIIDSNGHKLLLSNPENRISSRDDGKPILIEDDVWIGLSAIVLPGVRIGRGSVIGANTVVAGDVPSNVVFAGNPGSIIRRQRDDD